MPVRIVVGTQWGDEGKGKIVDLLAADADWVARCQGGANAGHTVVVEGQTHILHLIPSGVLRPGVRCAIGAGVVVDPAALAAEIQTLEAHGIDVRQRLLIDARAHVILDQHKRWEALLEERRGIGTTRRGIGPAYQAKVGRFGIRMVDLLDAARLKERLVALHEELPAAVRDAAAPVDEVVEQTLASTQDLTPLIGDAPRQLYAALAGGAHLLVECAQGTFLDVDHGTYPFVTSSTTTAAGVFAGLGLGPGMATEVVGVAKAYATRVGNGPFPSELNGPRGEELQRAGHEFGATTGRPRRCGWLDLVALRRAVELNGVDRLAVTKLDVLDGQPALPVVVDYEDHPRGAWYPELVAEDAKPVFETLPGWGVPTTGARALAELPEAARDYLGFIAERVGVPIDLVSVGSARDETIDVAATPAAQA